MHVALVNRWYPPHSGFGGVAIYMRDLAEALARQRHRVTVVAARWSESAPEFEVCSGVSVHRLLLKDNARLRRVPGLRRHARYLSLARYSVMVAAKLRELSHTDRPDVVEFADVEAEAFAYLRWPGRSRTVVRCHTPSFVLQRYYAADEMWWDNRRIAAREKWSIRAADARTAPSRDMAETILRDVDLPSDSISPIPNALDVKPYLDCAARRKPAKSPADPVVVLHVGRCDRGKGLGVLADAIPAVVKAAPNVRFLFAGDARSAAAPGSWRAGFEAKLDPYLEAGTVQFLGSLSQEELLQCYGHADIGVVPSLIYESFSYTCAQAMAARLPVVASRIGGIPETVPDGQAGLLVAPGDVSGLADSLITLAQDRSARQRMGCFGEVFAAQTFGAEVVAQRMQEVYGSTRA